MCVSESQAGYLQAIYGLRCSGRIHVKDIASRIGVSRPSVTGALRQLSVAGLVNYEPYGRISLTESGLKLGRRLSRTCEEVGSFLVEVLGVDSGVAAKTALRICCSWRPEAAARLLRLIRLMPNDSWGRWKSKLGGGGTIESETAKIF